MTVMIIFQFFRSEWLSDANQIHSAAIIG